MKQPAAHTAIGRLVDVARWSLFVLALAVLALCIALLVAEHSGWLARKLERELSAQLGEELVIESVDVDWFEPRVELRGVYPRAVEAHLRIERIDARLQWNGFAAPVLVRVDVDGGRVVLGRALFERLERPAQPASTAAARAPTLVVRNVQVDLAHPLWGELPLGSIDALGSQDASGLLEVEGRIAPSFAAIGVPAAREILLSATRAPDGRSQVHVWASALPVSAAAFPSGTPLAPVRAFDPRGELSLDLRASFDESGATPPAGRLHLRVEKGSLQPPGEGARIDDVAVALDARCTPQSLSELLDPRSWENTVHASATWNAHAIDAWALAGRNAGAGLAARAWLSIPCVPLSRELLDAFGLGENQLAATQWHALSPAGFARLALGLSWPSPAASDFDVAVRPIATAEIELDGDTTIRVNGWPARGRTEGFPLPIERIAGRLVALHDVRREHDTLIGLVRVLGAHSRGTSDSTPAFAEGLLRWTKLGVTFPELELRFGAHAVPVDERLREALHSIHGAEQIVQQFAPDGGSASVAARLTKGESELLPTMSLELDLRGVSASWHEMPARVHELDGELDLLLDPRRLLGFSFELRGETANAASARVAGRVQDDPAGPRALERWAERRVQAFEVEVENFGLRGDDRASLLSRQPDVREALERLGPEGEAEGGPQGRVDARYHGATLATGGPYAWRVEVEPRGEMQFAPQDFPVQWFGVRGRVIVAGEQPLVAGATRASGHARVVPFIGDWTVQTRVAVIADLPFEGDRKLDFLGSGIDVKNTDLVGAFGSLFEQYDSVSLDALRVDGRIDLTGELRIPRAAPQTPVGVYRVRLRENDVRLSDDGPAAGSGVGRGLDGLSGILVQQGNELRGERITASLASSPLLLRKARFFERDGRFTFETNLDARELPLDSEHLSLFLDPATVSALCDGLALRGTVDVESARLELLFADSARGDRVQFAGRALAREAYVDIGLPLSIDSAEIDIEQLVYEQNEVRVEALVRDLEGRVADRELGDGNLRFTYVEPHLSILELDAALEGGRLGGIASEGSRGGSAFSMDLEQPFPFDLAVRLEGVAVAGLLRGLFESDFASSGSLSGELRLNGDLERMTGIAGDGHVEMNDSVLWSIPVVREMFAQLGFDDVAVFERVRSRFQVEHGRIRMSDLRVYSKLLQLVGSGVLDFDGSLEHELEVRYSLVDRLGPLRQLLYWVQNNLLSVSIRGDMARPRVELEGVLGWMQSPRRVKRELPLPSFAPLPERF